MTSPASPLTRANAPLPLWGDVASWLFTLTLWTLIGIVASNRWGPTRQWLRDGLEGVGGVAWLGLLAVAVALMLHQEQRAQRLIQQARPVLFTVLTTLSGVAGLLGVFLLLFVSSGA